jgi:hypothetical protein
VAELAYARALGARPERVVGSNPTLSTIGYNSFMNRKGFTPIVIIGIIVALIIVGIIGYFIWKSSNTMQPTTSMVSNQKYVVIANYTYVASGPKDVSFSLYNINGQLVKTIPAPSDLLNAAGNIKLLGGQIYYMSGNDQLAAGTFPSTSIGAINVQTGQSKILQFTETNNTNPRNGLYAILDWDVSPDNSKVAWVNNSGKITVANIDGTNLQTYNNITAQQIKLTDSYLYFVDPFIPPGYDNPYQSITRYLGQINLSDNSTTTIINDLWNETDGISDSGTYIVYPDAASDEIIKNIQTNIEYTLPNSGQPDAVIFSPDETEAVLSYGSPDGSWTNIVNLSNGQVSSSSIGIWGFISDSRIVSDSGNQIVIEDLNGGNLIPLTSSSSYTEFEGVLTTD